MGLAMINAQPIDNALKIMRSGQADTVVVMENDLYRHYDANMIDDAIAKVDNLIVIDHQQTEIMAKAHLVLPASSFAESDGTMVSQEGRAQRYFQVFEPSFYNKEVVMHESWRWLSAVDSQWHERTLDWTQLDDVIEHCATSLPQFAGIVDAAPNASFRIRGQKLAREPHRYSGRTSMLANVSVHEQRQPKDIDTPFAFSMEGNNSPTAPRQQIPFAWARVGTHLKHGTNSKQKWVGAYALAIRVYA